MEIKNAVFGKLTDRESYIICEQGGTEMEFIFDEEKYFKKIDSLCTIALPEKYGTIHIASKYDNWLTVFPKDKVFPSFTKFVSPKEAIMLLEKEGYELRYSTGFGTKETIVAVWMLLDAVGKPYLKHWTDLVRVYAGIKEPLIYDGPNIDLPHKNRMVNQVWCYQMANAILGLENHDDLLQRFFHDEPDWKKAVEKTKILLATGK